MATQCTEFEVTSLSCFRDILLFQRYFRGTKIVKWVMWCDYAPFRHDQLSHQIWSLYVHLLWRYERQSKM